MTVKELRNALSNYPDDMEVLTKQSMISGNVASMISGNVAYVNSVREDSYRFFVMKVPCVLLTDEYDPKERSE